MLPKNKKAALAILGVLFLGASVCLYVAFDFYRQNNLEVIFFNVGQGDSAFIETPRHQQILIDGGPDSTVIKKLAEEMPFYDRTLDLVILTHPEKDHLAGLLDVLQKYEVKNILWTGVVRDTPEYQEWMKLLSKEEAYIKIAEAGQRIVLQESPLIYIDILNPLEGTEGEVLEDSNDSSIVARLSFGSDSFLFTGDASIKVEEKLNITASSVLKVAHHGSKNSTSESFLKKVAPKIAVISAGENNYGHPAPEVLARLSNFGINALITKLNGDVKIVSSGNNF